jgi:hypothetical protein
MPYTRQDRKNCKPLGETCGGFSIWPDGILSHPGRGAMWPISSGGLKLTDALHPPATADYVPRAPTC